MGSSDNYDMLKLENQLCFPLYVGARKVVNLYTPVFKPLGITYTQYIVLLVLWEHDGIAVGDLCHRLYLDSGTVTPLLKKMEAHGFLTRARDKDDERVVTVTLTDKGWALRKEAAKIPQQIGACLSLKPEEAQVLYSLLYRIINETDTSLHDLPSESLGKS